jgi:AraC-like DNA-binding protein
MGDFQFLVNPPGPRLARCSAVLNGYTDGTGPDYRAGPFVTTLSVKAVVRGSASYRTRHGHYRVTEDAFLVLNHGQEYTLEIDGRSHTETLCPFFQPGLFEHVAGCLTTPPERQLDDVAVRTPPAEFYERLYPCTGPVARALHALHAGLRTGGAGATFLEDRFYDLAAALAGLRAEVQAEVDRFPGRRPATREELYRRLHRGRDFLRSCHDQPLTVAQAARVAHLSPYHFHHTFRQAFGQTPMQFLQAQRLVAACRLLATTDRPVTAVCLAIGFESLGTFSGLFRRRFGLSPRQFRARRAGRRNPQD